MSRKETNLVCPSCRFSEIKLTKNKFFCQECNLFYNIKEDYPVLINFALDEVIIKEDEINIIKEKSKKNILKKKIINFFYGTSKVTQENVQKFLSKLKSDNKKILVIGGASKGAGTNDLWDNKKIEITSIDIAGTENVDYIADAHYLPFKNETFDAVWIQAVLEHVISPQKVVNEIHRTLKDGGIVYSEIPFMQQIHMGKHDFTRFTGAGHRYLFKNFEKINIGINGGPGVTLAWSLKYFVWSISNEKIANYISILPFLFLRLLDKFLSEKASWDSSSGYYFLGKKNNKFKFNKNELSQFYRGNQI